MARTPEVSRVAAEDEPGVERVTPKKPRIANASVLAVRVANLFHKDVMIAAEPAKFFTEPHYNGFPAVLVRLEAVSLSDLRELLEEGWRCQGRPRSWNRRRKRRRHPPHGRGR